MSAAADDHDIIFGLRLGLAPGLIPTCVARNVSRSSEKTEYLMSAWNPFGAA